MLTDDSPLKRDLPGPFRPQAVRSTRRERRLWHQPEMPIEPLGCTVCPDRVMCGGLRTKAKFFDCLQFCCGRPYECDRVCRNHPEFADRVREVSTFNLCTVPRAPLLNLPELPLTVPVLYHRSSRLIPLACDAVAFPLYGMFDRRSGAPNFTTHEALCTNLGIQIGTKVLLTGTDRDPPLERWWGLGEQRRLDLIEAMKSAGVCLVTTPNYSLFTDRPRQDDLHAMKRIAIVHEEFLRKGIPAALHTNGRTEADFARWAEYVSTRSEITHVAYEFTTGTGWAGRREQHAAWLSQLAKHAGRPLHLVIRGGTEVLPFLARAFAGVTVLDSSTFMKTMMRQSACRRTNSAIEWVRAPTLPGTPLDALLKSNLHAVSEWVAQLAHFPGG